MATRRLFLGAAIILLTLSGCAQGSGSGGSKAAQWSTFNMRLTGDWGSLDLQGQQNTSMGQLVFSGYDRLLARTSTFKLTPYLAKSWSTTPSSITFTLRTDATCSDGTPVTPTVVANSIRRWVDPKTGSTSAARFFGPGPFTITPDQSAHTLTFSVSYPWEGLEAGFADTTSGIVCPAGLANPSQLANGFYGSGAYTIVAATHGDQIQLKLRPEWKWGPQGTTAADLPQQFTFKVIANETTAANLLLQGGLDLGNISGPDAPRLTSDKSLAFVKSPSSATLPIFLNHAAGHPTADVAVRKAIMTVINQKDYAQAAFGGLALVSSTFLVPGESCYDANTSKLYPQTSVSAAQTILTGAGYTLSNGKLTKNGQPLTLALITSIGGSAGAEYIASQLNSMGATTSVDTSGLTGDFVARLRAGNFELAAPNTSTPNGEPFYGVQVVSGPFPPGGSNYSRVQNATVDSEVQQALLSSGPAKCQHWYNVQEELLKSADYIPTASPYRMWFGQKSLQYSPVLDWMELYTLRKK